MSRYESEETVRERRTPITRDQSIMEEDPETPALHQVRRCQKEVGELLWLVTRTRPDLMFSVARMGANVTKATKSVLETASQTRDYLKRTVVKGLMIGEQKEREVCIQAFADASFSPDGEESHGSYVVFANDSPLFWRSGRQTTVTLSTAESELTELVEAISAGEAVAVIVSELFQDIKKFAWSDSQSALAILVNEGGNWRTRHLRMRAAYTRQAVHSGEWGVGHLPGDRMVADIGTKALTSQRIDVLKQHLGMSSTPTQPSVIAPVTSVAALKPSVIAPATSVAALKPSVIAHATSEDARKGMDGAKMSQAATALKLITLAAMISAGKSQEEEDMEEGQKELQLIMAAFAILVVLITLVAQHVWKVGVGLWNRGNEQIPEKQIRSLPAQEGRRSDQTADQRKAGSADGEKGLAEREPVRLPSGDREKALQPSLLGEKGLARGEPVRLPGPEATSSGLSGGPGPAEKERKSGQKAGQRKAGCADGEKGLARGEPVRLPGQEEASSSSSGGPGPAQESLEKRIERELEKIKEEETELWRQANLAPLPPVLIEPVEESEEEGLRFPVMRTKYGSVYHSALTCKHLQGAKVNLPRTFKWCQVCRGVALRTRGRPPPGTNLLLSAHGNAIHTDDRCPWVKDAKPTPFCLTCKERERG